MMKKKKEGRKKDEEREKIKNLGKKLGGPPDKSSQSV